MVTCGGVRRVPPTRTVHYNNIRQFELQIKKEIFLYCTGSFFMPALADLRVLQWRKKEWSEIDITIWKKREWICQDSISPPAPTDQRSIKKNQFQFSKNDWDRSAKKQSNINISAHHPNIATSYCSKLPSCQAQVEEEWVSEKYFPFSLFTDFKVPSLTHLSPHQFQRHFFQKDIYRCKGSD